MHDAVVIVTGAEPLDPSVVRDLPTDAIVFAADGGLDHALAAGLTPTSLIGDLDSVSPEGLAWAEQHATIERHPEGKDQTDTELALEVANALLPERLVLLAGGGDRLDHTLAALGALGQPALTSIPLIECWWGTQRIRVLHGPGTATLHPRPGSRLSILALHGPCQGVTVRGTRWELDRFELAPAVGRGVSNVVEQPPVSLRVSLGVLTVFFEPDADHPLDDPGPATVR